MAAMMDLKNVPDLVGKQLAQRALQLALRRDNVAVGVANYFYDDLYTKWSQGSRDVKYEMNLPAKGNEPAKPDAGWKQLAQKLVGIATQGKKLGEAYSDDTRGIIYEQQDSNDPEHRGTRLGEEYSDATMHGRFQFVVSRGGGMVLLNRMRRACQQFMADNAGVTVVGAWKVFGEANGVGRSDSCVAYLVEEYDAARTSTFIERYLWPNIKDLVADQFVPIGLIRLGGKPIWALGYPPIEKYRQIFGHQSTEDNYTSAGGMMGDVFGHAFKEAVDTTSGVRNADKLVAPAKAKARALLHRLG
jgi:hypothetical protein